MPAAAVFNSFGIVSHSFSSPMEHIKYALIIVEVYKMILINPAALF